MATGGAKKPGSAEKPAGAIDPAAVPTADWGAISIEGSIPFDPTGWVKFNPWKPRLERFGFVIKESPKVSEIRSGKYGESKGFGFVEIDDDSPYVLTETRDIGGSPSDDFLGQPRIEPLTSEQVAALTAASVPSASPADGSHNTAMADQPTRAEIDAKLEAAEERTARLIGETAAKLDKLLALQEQRERSEASRQADRDRAADLAEQERKGAADQRERAATALQAQRDVAAAGHQARLDKQIGQVMASNSQLKTTIIGTGVAVVLGIAAFNATVLSNMVSSFESGRNTAQAISELAKRVDESAKTVAEAASAAKAVERSADKHFEKAGEKPVDKRGGK